MKKVGIFFIIFIILGVVVFFSGWVQLNVPIGSYGVMRSKTHGIDPRIIQDGEFRWVWYKLIPTNVSLEIFNIQIINRQVRIQSSLPSGAEYANFAGFTADFSYDISANISFNIRPDSLISLLSSRNITDQESLNLYERQVASNIETFATQRFSVYVADEQRVQEMLNSASIVQLERDIASSFPLIENVSCIINASRFPDFVLFNKFRLFYNEYLVEIQRYVRDESRLRPEARIASFVRLDELAKYGELLTQYPILIDFLDIESRSR